MEEIALAAKTFIRWTTAACGQSVGHFIQERANSEQPLLAWAEPDPAWKDGSKPGRVAGFRPLVAGKPDWPAQTALVEARLFWRDKALHVIAAKAGSRWAQIEEGDGATEAVFRRVKPVLPLRDFGRFGLAATDVGGELELNAIEYWLGGRLVGWRLVPLAEQE